MAWNARSPRAFFPPEELAVAGQPTAACATLARKSPLPRALGVYVVHGSERRALPLVYVSRSVARARGRGVREGWYAPAEPGQQFEVRITATRNHDLVFGRALGVNEGVRYELLVDNVAANSGYTMTRDCKLGSETIVAGYTKAVHYEAGCADGREVLRKFVFRRSQTVEEDSDRETPAGCIRLRFLTGTMQFGGYAYHDRENELKEPPIVAEKETVKTGATVSVERSGRETRRHVVRACSFMDEKGRVDEGEIVVYLREKYWLTSRIIMREDGLAWKEEGVDLVEGVYPIELDQVVRKRRKVNSSFPNASELKGIRRVSRNTVEVIDLTEDSD